MSFRNCLTILSFAALSLTLFACASQPRSDIGENPEQLASIMLWHQCVDTNLQNLKQRESVRDPNDTIEHTLVACQGHREDVLATFPSKLERPLNKIMVKKTYEAGYSLFAASKGLPKDITPVTLDAVLQHKLR